MLFKNISKNKKVLIIVSIVVLLIGILALLSSPVIFQEGSLYPQIKGIVQLNFTNKDMVKLSGSDNKYMTKSKNGQEVIKNFMKNKGYEFTEQMGSGYLFKSSTEKSAIVTHKYYSRFYSLWNITENTKQTQNTIAEELQECLPKSDIASHERCNELLATIRNFDDCVNAGFSIIKSNPLQCATLDGRTFIDETNSTWGIVLATLNNCEAESVFQTHSKFVTLKLKNGNEVTAYEPQIDNIMKAVDDLKGRCGNIRMGTV